MWNSMLTSGISDQRLQHYTNIRGEGGDGFGRVANGWPGGGEEQCLFYPPRWGDLGGNYPPDFGEAERYPPDATPQI